MTKLVDADGKMIDRLADPKQTLNVILPDYGDQTFPVLGRIPRYGDDILIPGELMAEFLTELERVRLRAETPVDREYLQRLVALAERCRASTGCSLEFLGD